jgi:chorismate synthase
LYGESHGNAIGIIINNLPGGIPIDLDRIRFDLTKRRPKSNISTSRQEKDLFEFLSGYYDGKTTGTPLTIAIKNNDTRSRDYTPNILRPSHADYTAYVKYNGSQDYRGGGHFSGRITTPIVILGSIAAQILEQKGIYIASHIKSIKDVSDETFTQETTKSDTLKTLLLSDFPLLNSNVEDEMKETILDAKRQKDSVGGVVETAIVGLSAGYGDPFFDSIESTLAHLLYSVPAVKGVSFGAGFDITTLYGSEANDNFVTDGKNITTTSNNSGGIQGGISNGMPITFNVAIKPTASIGKPQNTVDIDTLSNTVLELKGRHDPCIVHRVIHVINAITSYGILEIIARKEGLQWINSNKQD